MFLYVVLHSPFLYFPFLLFFISENICLCLVKAFHSSDVFQEVHSLPVNKERALLISMRFIYIIRIFPRSI